MSVLSVALHAKRRENTNYQYANVSVCHCKVKNRLISGMYEIAIKDTQLARLGVLRGRCSIAVRWNEFV